MSEHALKTYRDDHGLTQEGLAQQLGVSSITVSRWETGTRKIAPGLLPKIQKVTGIPTRELRPDLAEILERT